MISHISIVNFFRVEVLFVKVLDCQNVAIVDAPRMKLIFLARDNFLKMMFYLNFFNNQSHHDTSKGIHFDLKILIPNALL